MKPNVGELISLVSACMQDGLVTKNKASVQIALESCQKHLTAVTQGHAAPADMLTDVRVLAIALLGQMRGSSNIAAVRMVTGEGLPHKVMGKHVFVSLGAQGMLWSGPREALLHVRAGQKIAAPTNSKYAVVIVDDLTACKLVPSVPIDPKDIINSNGAGDAFCAGLINALYNGDSSCTRLDTLCVEAGMAAAHRALMTKPGN
jgi:fructose-1-phosphate kinase PfkB-like protein